MPKSSRHKSHKQSKHSSKDARDHSDSDDDSRKIKERERNGKEDTSVRVSRDLSSGDKRKSTLQSRDGKDLSNHGNGEATDEYVASKRRKDRGEVGASDRWNGGGDERGDAAIGDKEVKGESSRIDSDKGLKTRTSFDLKSKSSRRHDSSEKKEDSNVGSVMEKEENKSVKVESKRKLEKDKPEKEKSERDSSRKEVSQLKDLKEKERGLEKDRQVQDSKRDLETRSVDVEAKRKQGSQPVDAGEEQKVKRGSKNAEWLLKDELRNHELEKEVEKRIRRKGDGSSDKDKHQDDKRDGDDRRLSSRGEHDKDGRYKDGNHRDKYRDDVDRDSRHRDVKQKEDIDREKRHRVDKYRDERAARDRPSDKSDSKHLRDDSDAAESRNKKSRTEGSNRDGSPTYDDRSVRYKDDKGKRRYDDIDDQSDLRSRSYKEQRSDLDKKSMSSGKLEPVTDRERPRSRHADIDSTLSNSRRRSSPNSSSHAAKDQYRYSKQAEAKYRDSAPEERSQHYVSSGREVSGGSGVPGKTNMSRSMDKFIPKDDSHLGGLSAERRSNSDARGSPMQLMEKSPSSSSTDRRHLNRSGVRQSLDVEDSGQRRGGSKERKDYSVNEGKGSQDFHVDAYSVDEHSQADGDNMSVSSPFIRTNYMPGHPKSLLPPPPPFRSGVDNSSGFGSFEDDSRGKSNNRFKRMGDSNMGRVHGNSWKGVPNWPSPVANGFIPFQHGPPPVGFHPVMQQFSIPPMFGVRPSIELNHPGVQFHIPDADRFSGHGRPYGWRNPVDDSCPPPIHGWDSNNGAVGDGSHTYGRLDWDHNRNLINSGGWESGVEMWKGQNAGMATKLPTAPKKEDTVVHATDEVLADQLSQQAQNEQNQLDLLAESIDINHSGDALTKGSFEAPEITPEKTLQISKISNDEDANLSHIYLAKLDVSADLTHPKLYNECTSLVDVEQNAIIDVDASSVAEVEGVVEARVKISNSTTKGSLFAAINDSIFQRAMSLYKKQREEIMATYLPSLSTRRGSVPLSNVGNLELGSTTEQENVVVPMPLPNGVEHGMLDSTSDQRETEIPVPIFNQEEAEMQIVLPKIEAPVAIPNDKEDAPAPAEMLEIRVDVSNLTLKEVKMEVNPEFDHEMSIDVVEDKLSSPASKVHSETTFPSNSEITKRNDDTGLDCPSGNLKEEKLVDSGPLLYSNVSSEACEAMMPELNESGSVNLNRIHHLPESTH